MPKYLSGDGPPKKKPAPNIARAMAAATARPDALPARPQGPPTIPQAYVGDVAMPGTDSASVRIHKRVASDLGVPFEIRQVTDPNAPKVPIPSTLVRLPPEDVPEALKWQAPFLDTLTQLIGARPSRLRADMSFTNAVAGEFNPVGNTIYLSGNIAGMTPGSAGHTRWAAAHEFGHLLSHGDSRIMQAFVNAAPLPRRLNTREYDYSKPLSEAWTAGGRDTTRTPGIIRNYIAGEAFADMFADALARKSSGEPRFPEMWNSDQQWVHYPFSDQFRGRSRQMMVDSLVNSLAERLKP